MKVFVYGTLMTGQPNNYLLKNARKLSNGKTGKLYRMYTNGAYPMIRPDRLGYSIHGEIFEADAETMKALDRLEGTPTLYTRDSCVVVDDSGDKQMCFVYVWSRSGVYREIASGKWTDFSDGNMKDVYNED
jgi:gamma-glutamylaminecyclotransferase